MIEPARPRWLSFVFAAPVLALMVSALINDPGRVGTRSSASDIALAGISFVAYLLTVLLVLVWCFSTFRYRGCVVLAQIVVVWTGGMLYAFDVRTETTWWDVAEDLFFLVTTLAQLLPGRPTGSSTGPSTDSRRSRSLG